LESKEKSNTTLIGLKDLITALAESERTTYNHLIQSLKLKPNTFDK
jgi:hypothetical protein